jgi:DNA segregation ATPase FtsK/SpoIIIE-like protein
MFLTILDEGGAENLHEQGVALVKLPRNAGIIQKIKSSLIWPDEIPGVLDEIRARHEYADYSYVMNEPLLLEADTQSGGDVVFTTAAIESEEDTANRLFADIIIWTLGRKEVGGNTIFTAFEKVSQRDGAKFIDKLHKFGIISGSDSTKRRTVLITKIEDLTEDAIAFLERYGYSRDDVAAAIDNRN